MLFRSGPRSREAQEMNCAIFLVFFVQNLFLHSQISNYCSFVFTANKEGNCTGIFFPGFRSIGERLNLAP